MTSVRDMSIEALEREKASLQTLEGGAPDLDVRFRAVEAEIIRRRTTLPKPVDELFPDRVFLIWDHLKQQMLTIPDHNRARAFAANGYLLREYRKGED